MLAVIPAYFYFVPELLFPPLYKRYIKDVFYEMNSNDGLAFEHIEKLKTRVTRILRFIAFLSIMAVTVVATFYNREHRSYFHKDCLLTALLIALCGLSGWLTHVNTRQKFSINSLEAWLERLMVVSTVPLIYLWG